ncbi:MAG: hypothetical protein JNL90_13975 [Planctomycetes bacterium]|nr:hypothetical protein [Planctomycetota bacterium]
MRTDWNLARTLAKRARRRGARGMALVTVLSLLTATAGVTYLCLSSSMTALDRTTERIETSRLESTAASAADLLAANVWNGFVAANGGTAGNLNEFRTYLAAQTNLFGTPIPDAGAPFDARAALRLPTGSDGAPRLGGLAIAQLTVRRIDSATRTDLEIEATAQTGATADAGARTVRQVVSIAGDPFDGFAYGLLSNNVNCIFCHARFDNAERFYNTDPTKHGTFDRIRVGTLESMLVRVGSAESQIAGTLYVRGKVTDKTGNLLPDLHGSSVTGNDFDTVGKLLQDSNGDMAQVELYAGSATPFQHLYMDYPLDESQQVDGPLPASFPPPVPDLDGDKLVDADEFAEVAGSATGSLSAGVIFGVDKAASYSGSALPTTSNLASVSGTTDKRLILRGTDANPLQIEGMVAVDGDVVIEGVIKGDGVLLASGNVYVLGNLTYADGVDANGARTFGRATDGTKNALAVAAGGNILIGNYLTDANGAMVTGNGSGKFNFTMSELMLFNRTEWSRTQAQLPNKYGVLKDNPLYDPTYKPRYYVHGNNDPVLVFNKTGTKTTKDHYFSVPNKTWMGKEHLGDYDTKYMSSYAVGSPTYNAAAIVTLGPKGNWISESTLSNFCGQVDAAHDGGPLVIDSLLYTNNSAFALVRDDSVYGGQMTLNGALVAADTGVLVPGNGTLGLQLNYDARLASKLNLTDITGPTTMTRSLLLPVVGHP